MVAAVGSRRARSVAGSRRRTKRGHGYEFSRFAPTRSRVQSKSVCWPPAASRVIQGANHVRARTTAAHAPAICVSTTQRTEPESLVGGRTHRYVRHLRAHPRRQQYERRADRNAHTRCPTRPCGADRARAVSSRRTTACTNHFRHILRATGHPVRAAAGLVQQPGRCRRTLVGRARLDRTHASAELGRPGQGRPELVRRGFDGSADGVAGVPAVRDGEVTEEGLRVLVIHLWPYRRVVGPGELGSARYAATRIATSASPGTARPRDGAFAIRTGHRRG